MRWWDRLKQLWGVQADRPAPSEPVRRLVPQMTPDALKAHREKRKKRQNAHAATQANFM